MTHVVSVDGTRIAVERSGSGRPLVLVHGSASTARTFDGLRALLPHRYEVFAMTRRGRGRSGDGDAAIATEGADVRAVLDLAGPDAVVLAHSYGARLTLEALLQGATIARAVLYEPVTGTDRGVPPDEVAQIEALERANDPDAAVLAFFTIAAGTPPAAAERLRGTAIWALARDSVGTLGRETLTTYRDPMDDARFARIATPCRFLLGDRSPPYFATAAERFAAAVPGAEVVRLEGQGHMALHLAPEAVLRAAGL